MSDSGDSANNSPLHQKLKDFEDKLRRWNILPVSGHFRSRSERPGCMTTPLPRRPPPSLVGIGAPGTSQGKIRKREVEKWKGTLNQSTSNNHRLSDSADVQRRLNEIMQLTGVLRIDGQEVRCKSEDLVQLGELGHGTCGHVFKMQEPTTGTVMAVKQMRRTGNKEENKRVIMDLDVVLRSHECIYIVRCLGCFITDSDVWICMEMMATCLEKLSKKLNGPIPENILGKMAVSIVKALDYLKSVQGIIHRDVKPSNMLLDWHGTIKLCDFGISGKLVDSRAKTRTAGCAAYMAPERIEPPDPHRPDYHYDIRADVWSLGISLVELATGRFPYADCSSDFEVLSRILNDDPPILSVSDGFTPQFCTFVQKCLTKDYNERPKYKKLLEDRFIKQYEKENVDIASWFKEVQERFNGHFTPSPDANSNHPGVNSLADELQITRL